MDAASSNNTAEVSNNVTNSTMFGDIDLHISNKTFFVLLQD